MPQERTRIDVDALLSSLGLLDRVNAALAPRPRPTIVRGTWVPLGFGAYFERKLAEDEAKRVKEEKLKTKTLDKKSIRKQMEDEQY